MPDVCDLILDDHQTFRRRFAELDEERRRRESGERSGPVDSLAGLWQPLGTLLDLHAAAEEEVFYPRLVRRGADGAEETTDAIKDHNQIRDAVADAATVPVGGEVWWDAVGRARVQNSDHMAEEERGALADFRRNVDEGLRHQLGARFAAFKEEHAGGRRLEAEDKDPEGYVADSRG